MPRGHRGARRCEDFPTAAKCIDVHPYLPPHGPRPPPPPCDSQDRDRARRNIEATLRNSPVWIPDVQEALSAINGSDEGDPFLPLLHEPVWDTLVVLKERLTEEADGGDGECGPVSAALCNVVYVASALAKHRGGEYARHSLRTLTTVLATVGSRGGARAYQYCVEAARGVAMTLVPHPPEASRVVMHPFSDTPHSSDRVREGTVRELVSLAASRDDPWGAAVLSTAPLQWQVAFAFHASDYPHVLAHFAPCAPAALLPFLDTLVSLPPSKHVVTVLSSVVLHTPAALPVAVPVLCGYTALKESSLAARAISELSAMASHHVWEAALFLSMFRTAVLPNMVSKYARVRLAVARTLPTFLKHTPTDLPSLDPFDLLEYLVSATSPSDVATLHAYDTVCRLPELRESILSNFPRFLRLACLSDEGARFVKGVVEGQLLPHGGTLEELSSLPFSDALTTLAPLPIADPIPSILQTRNYSALAVVALVAPQVVKAHLHNLLSRLLEEWDAGSPALDLVRSLQGHAWEPLPTVAVRKQFLGHSSFLATLLAVPSATLRIVADMSIDTRTVVYPTLLALEHHLTTSPPVVPVFLRILTTGVVQARERWACHARSKWEALQVQHELMCLDGGDDYLRDDLIRLGKDEYCQRYAAEVVVEGVLGRAIPWLSSLLAEGHTREVYEAVAEFLPVVPKSIATEWSAALVKTVSPPTPPLPPHLHALAKAIPFVDTPERLVAALLQVVEWGGSEEEARSSDTDTDSSSGSGSSCSGSETGTSHREEAVELPEKELDARLTAVLLVGDLLVKRSTPQVEEIILSLCRCMAVPSLQLPTVAKDFVRRYLECDPNSSPTVLSVFKTLSPLCQRRFADEIIPGLNSRTLSSLSAAFASSLVNMGGETWLDSASQGVLRITEGMSRVLAGVPVADTFLGMVLSVLCTIFKGKGKVSPTILQNLRTAAQHALAGGKKATRAAELVELVEKMSSGGKVRRKKKKKKEGHRQDEGVLCTAPTCPEELLQEYERSLALLRELKGAN
eukprot:Sspe_Gene.29471::Locus_14019_Transcript_1_1_Confidence_1.000_Length_3207::g.29471::m.29471